MLLWSAIGCGEDPAATPPGEVAVGVDLAGLSVDLPACEPGPTDGRLDLEGGCAEGVCLGQSLAEADEGYGEPAFCAPLYDTQSVACFYGEWILAELADRDADGVPDDDARIYAVNLILGWDGGTVEGLAMETSLACWFDVLGGPSTATFMADGQRFPLVTAEWDDLYLLVSDALRRSGEPGHDGRVDAITLRNGLYFR